MFTSLPFLLAISCSSMYRPVVMSGTDAVDTVPATTPDCRDPWKAANKLRAAQPSHVWLD